ncbi:hypothetical protein AMTRI_Chr06g175720 [Amborella trichopoda]
MPNLSPLKKVSGSQISFHLLLFHHLCSSSSPLHLGSHRIQTGPQINYWGFSSPFVQHHLHHFTSFRGDSSCFYSDKVVAKPSNSLQDLLKLFNCSPETIRRFWRQASRLEPDDVLNLLLLLQSRKTIPYAATLSWKLFNWASSQFHFCHLPQSYMILLSMLVKAGFMKEAESILQSMEDIGVLPNVGAFDMFIEGYVKSGNLESAMMMYDRARGRGLIISSACGRGLLHFLIKRNQTQLAFDVYLDMMKASMDTDVHALEMLVALLCKDKRVGEARNLLERASHLGLKWSQMVINRIANAYHEEHDFHKLLCFLNELECAPDALVCNKIITFICREGGTREAWLLVNRLEDIGFKPDEVTFEILIICGCREGNLRGALMFLSELFSRGLKPDFYTYNAIIAGVFKERMGHHAKEVLYDMIERGITPNLSTFRILLAGYCKEAKFEEAKEIVREMVTHGCISPPLVSEDPLVRAFAILGLDPLNVKIKRDNTLGLLKTEFFDTLGNGLYLDTNIQEYESTLMGILDEAMMFPNFSLSIVRECSVGHLEAALKLKDAMVQMGLSPSAIAWSEIVKGLCAGGYVEKALDVIEETPELGKLLDQEAMIVLIQTFFERKMSSRIRPFLNDVMQRELPIMNDLYTTLLIGLCEEGSIKELDEYWAIARRKGWLPGLNNCKTLAACLCREGMLGKVMELVEIMISNGNHSSSKMCNLILEELCCNGFAQVGYDLVHQVHRSSLTLDHEAYKHLLMGFCKEKKFSEAIYILDILLEKKIALCFDAYKVVVPCLFRWNKLEEALKIHEISINKQLGATVEVYNILVIGLCEAGKVSEATKQLQGLLSKGFFPDKDTLDAILQGYCKEANITSAMLLLCIMLKKNLCPSISSYRQLVRQLCTKSMLCHALRLEELIMFSETENHLSVHCNILLFHLSHMVDSLLLSGVVNKMRSNGFVVDQFTCNLLIASHCKCKNISKSLQILKLMLQNNLQPSIRSFNIVISCLCRQGSLGEGLELSSIMESKGWVFGSMVQSSLVEGLLLAGRIEEAEAFLSRIEQKGLVSCNVGYDFLIKRLCNYDRVNKAINLLNVMLKKGSIPSDTSYNSIIHALCVRKEFDEALDFHAEMLHKNLEPSMEACEALIFGLCGDGRTEEAKRQLDDMLRRGQIPTSIMYQTVVDTYYQANNVKGASQVLRDMQHCGYVPDFKTHWSLISNLSNDDKESNNKGFLSRLLSQSGFLSKDSSLGRG